mgnify:CR=1 FL=1
MKIILKQSVETLGEAGDIVNVKPGYGRNYIIPQGIGVLATKSSIEATKNQLEQKAMKDAKGPAVAATDYMKLYADQVRQWVPTSYRVLGTDGFGRSDSRANLRKHFEVDANHVVVAALKELVDAGDIDAKVLSKAIKDYGIDVDKLNPRNA